MRVDRQAGPISAGGARSRGRRDGAGPRAGGAARRAGAFLAPFAVAAAVAASALAPAPASAQNRVTFSAPNTLFNEMRKSTPLVQVERDAGNQDPVSVTVALVDRTCTGGRDEATEGVDFAMPAVTTLTWAASSSVAQRFSFDVFDDHIPERDECFHLELTNLVNAVIGNHGRNEVRITNDDMGFALEALTDVDEGHAGEANDLFIVHILPQDDHTGWNGPSVDWAITGGTAVRGVDYTGAASGTLIFTHTATDGDSLPLPIKTIGNDMIGTDKTIEVRLSNPVPAGGIVARLTAASQSASSATATIRDDDDGFRISALDPPLEGGPGGSSALCFSVTSGTMGGDVGIWLGGQWSDAQSAYVGGFGTGTAEQGVDYTLPSYFSTYVNADGRQTAVAEVTGFGADEGRQFCVNIVGDNDLESDETVVATLDPTFTTLIARERGEATGVIRTDDYGVSVGPAAVDEGATGTTAELVFPVTLNATTTSDVSVDWSVAGDDATAGADFQADSGTAMIAAGSTSTEIRVTVIGDDLGELDETVTVTISNPSPSTVGIGQATAVGTIRNDDPPKFQVVAKTPTVPEGAAGTTVQACFEVSLTIPSNQFETAYVWYNTGTAAPIDDYLVPFGLGSWRATGEQAATQGYGFPTGDAGPVEQCFTVNGDGDPEDDETIVATLVTPGGPNTTTRALVPGRESATVVIRNDDYGVSVGAAAVDEGDAGDRPTLAFPVTLNAATTSDVSVDWSVAGDTATAGTDFQAANGTATIAAGATTTTINVTVIGDTDPENHETLTVTLSNPMPATVRITGATATGTIRSDDGTVISLLDGRVLESDAGETARLCFPLTITPATTSVITVIVDTTAGGTAVAGTDYVSGGGTLQIPGGTTRDERTCFTVNGDDLVEPDETVMARIDQALNATIGRRSATGTIVNDDVPTLSVGAAPNVNEGDTGTTDLVFPVRLYPLALTETTFDWAVTGGTAEGDTDLRDPKRGTIAIPAGSSSSEIRVAVAGDDVFERQETVQVTLSNPSPSTVPIATGSASAIGRIDNDDLPRISIDSPAVDEGDSGTTDLTFTVTVTGSPLSVASDVTFDWTLGGTATDGTDYTPPAGRTGTIPTGQTSTTITVAVTGDTDGEADETVTVTLSNPQGATIERGTGTGTIRNDDLPAASVGPAPAVAEGGPGATAALVFPVTLSEPSEGAATVDWEVTGGTADAATDIRGARGTVRIPRGATSTEIRVTVVGDDVYEADETVEVTLSNPTGPVAVPAGSTAAGTITNDDDPALAIDSPTVNEGDAGTTDLTFTVTIGEAGYASPVTFDWNVGGTAAAGTDYTLPAGRTGTVPAGSTSTTITATVTGDGEDEDDETVVITLSNPNPSNVRIGEGTGTGTIRNDDAPVLSIAPAAAVTERGDDETAFLVFTVTLDKPARSDVTAEYRTVRGAATAGTELATAGTDFRSTRGRVVIRRGQTEATVGVAVLGDGVFERDETVTVEISNLGGKALIQGGRATAAGIIENDDVPSISIDPAPPVNEGDAGTSELEFEVSLWRTPRRQERLSSTEDVTFEWDVTGGTAASATDLRIPASRTFTIPAGTASTTLRVAVVGDVEDENDETVEVTLSNPNRVTIPGGSVTVTGTIRNDDVPEASIGSPSVNEGPTGRTAELVFPVTLSRVPRIGDARIDWTTAASVGNDAAAPGADFRAARGTLTIPRGEDSGRIRIAVLGDNVLERDETVEVVLSNPAGRVTIPGGTATGTGTILNDDLPVLSVDSPVTVVEGGAGDSPTLAFTVRLGPLSVASEVTVDYEVTGLTATAGTDFQARSGTLPIPAGDTSATIPVTVVGDDLAGEADETVRLVLRNPSGARIPGGSLTRTGTIIEDDFPAASIGSPSPVNEGRAGETALLVFPVTLAAASTREATIDYRVTGGTATSTGAGADFRDARGRLSIPEGRTETSIVVAVNGDGDVEADETVEVTLSNPTGALITGTQTGTGTIRNDDVPPVSIAGPAAVDEGDAGDTPSLAFTAEVPTAGTYDLMVDWEVTSVTATAGEDFRAASGTATVPAGATSTVIDVTVIGDGADEPDETLEVTLSNARSQVTGITEPVSAAIGEDTGIGTIRDDDEPALSIGPASVAEGAPGARPKLSFTVTQSAASFEATTLDWRVTGETARAGSDFQAARGALTIPAGDTSGTIEVTVIGDDAYEDHETVEVEISNARGRATIPGPDGKAVATGTITDDDMPRVSVLPAETDEGDSGDSPSLTFAVTIGDLPARSPVTVTWAVTGGTATAGTDFQAGAGGTATIPAGSTSTAATVTVTGDATPDEEDETVVITLSGPTGATIAAGRETATGVIREDDLPEASIAGGDVVDEGPAGGTALLTFEVTLDRAAPRRGTIDYETRDVSGGASRGADFRSTRGRIVFPRGATSTRIAVAVVGDEGDGGIEPDETVTVAISNPLGGVRLDGGADTLEATGTIRNDDFPALSIDSPEVAEDDAGTEPLRFTVTLSATSSFDATFDWSVTGGTASSSLDFQAAGGAGTIPAGMASTSLRITVVDDDLDEGDETVVVTLSNPNNATVPGGGLTGTGTIREGRDDIPTVSFGTVRAVDEGDAGDTPRLVFPVTLSTPSLGDTTVDWTTVAGAATSGVATVGEDFRAARGTLTIPAGSTAASATVTVIGDDVLEPHETVTVAISNARGRARIEGGATSTAGTITDDDVPTLSLASSQAYEGDVGETPSLAFTVTLSPMEGRDPVLVDWAVTGGTADGTDYQAPTSGTLTIPAGDTSGTIDVMITGDGDTERDETVVLTLSNPRDARLSGGRDTLVRTGTIREDDFPAVSIDSPSADEGDALVFTVTLDAASPVDATVDYEVATSGTATLGEDFRAARGRVLIPAGELTGSLVVAVPDDDEYEPNETVEVTLSNPRGAVIEDAGGDVVLGAELTGTGTIVDNDVPTLEIDSPMADEGATGTTPDLAFEVSLKLPMGLASREDVTFSWDVTGGTATPDEDFQAASGTGTIPAGMASTLIRIAMIGDDTIEPDETVVVTLSSSTGAVLGDRVTGTGTIRNDDTPTFEIASSTVMESNMGATTTLRFTVTLDPPADATTTVAWHVIGGTARAGEDFPASQRSGRLVFPAGARSATIEIDVIGDDEGEEDETVVIALSGAERGAAIGTGRGRGTIINNDPPTFSIVARPDRSLKGTLAFEVTLMPKASATTTVAWSVTDAATLDDPPRSSGTLTFASSTASMTLRVRPVTGAEAVTAAISAPSAGAQLSTFPERRAAEIRLLDTDRRTDALRYVLAGIGRTIASNIVDVFWDRLGGDRAGGSHLTLAGRALDTGAFAAGGGAEGASARRIADEVAGVLGVDLDSGALLRGAERRFAAGRGLGALRDWTDIPDEREIVRGTRFQVTFANGDGRHHAATIWGQGGISSFASDLDDFNADGEVTQGLFGFDYRLRNDVLLGVAVSHAAGDVDYSFGDAGTAEGAIKTTLTSAHPYVRWTSSAGRDFWASLGYGGGTAEFEEDGAADGLEADTTMQMAAFGVRDSLVRNGDFDFALKADAFAVRTSADEVREGGVLRVGEVDADASRMRLALEGSSRQALAGGALIAGRFELGARYDGGDAEEGAGADVAGSFSWTVPRLGLALEGRGRMLLVHEEGGFEDWGLGLGVSWAPGPDGRGPSFSLEPVWGAPARSASMWDANTGSLSGRSSRGASLNARFGYGLGVLGDRATATVFGELGRADGDDRLRLGTGLGRKAAGGHGLGIELYGERRERAAGPDHAVVLKGRIGF